MSARKVRPDAILRQLPEERQAAIFEKLQKDSYAKVQQWLAKDGIKVGTTALGDFYQFYVIESFQRKAEVSRQEMSAAILANRPEYSLEQATEMADAHFISVSAMSGDFENYIPIRKIVAGERKVDLDRRRLALLEAKAAKAAELEKSLTERRNKGGVSPETLELIESSLGMLR